MSQWGAAPGPDPEGVGPESVGGENIPDTPAELTGARAPDDPGEQPGPVDMVGVAAVAVGFIGIVVFGILAALLAAFLGAWAGQRARDAGRSMQTGYLAIGLACVDGVVWLALHFLFELPVQIG